MVSPQLISLLETEAVLISNPHSPHRDLIATLKARIQGHLDSTKCVCIEHYRPPIRTTIHTDCTPPSTPPPTHLTSMNTSLQGYLDSIKCACLHNCLTCSN